MSVQTVSSTAVAHALTALRANRPLVHCLTNEVVQEITANVLPVRRPQWSSRWKKHLSLQPSRELCSSTPAHRTQSVSR